MVVYCMWGMMSQELYGGVSYVGMMSQQLYGGVFSVLHYFQTVHHTHTHTHNTTQHITSPILWIRTHQLHCATSSRVRFPMVSLEFFIHNPSSRTMTLGSTHPLTEMSTRNIS